MHLALWYVVLVCHQYDVCANSAQYLARCLEQENVCHSITTRGTPNRQMKKTLYTRYHNTVEPMMVTNDRKATLQALHTDAVNKAVKRNERNIVLNGCPPPISNSEKDLTRKEYSTLAQRSGYCGLLPGDVDYTL